MAGTLYVDNCSNYDGVHYTILEGQRSLVCCSSWGLKESDMTVMEQHSFIIKTL